MSSQNTIQDELKSLGCGLPVVDSPVFSVPEGYFEGLAAAILARVKSLETPAVQDELAALSPLLASLPKTTPYTVPSSYFDNNLAAPAAFEDETSSLVLAAIGKAMPFELPQDYFNSLPTQVLAKVAPQQTKVVPLFARTWMRVAAAAVVAGALAVGGLQFFGKKSEEVVAVQQPVPTNQSYTASVEPVAKKELKQVSTKEIEEFIETVQTNPEKEAKAESVVSTKKTVQELVKDVPTDEMESFLSTLPSPDEELSATDEP